eukprot:jgi/Picre1/27451/NNA_000418.t1
MLERSNQPTFEQTRTEAQIQLFTVSVVGGAVIKYGSLIISLPFHPDGFIAVSIIAFPPACFAAWMLTQPGKQS